VEFIVGFFGSVLRSLFFYAVFFWPGWLVLNVLTLGRYPRLRKPRRGVNRFVSTFPCHNRVICFL